MNDQKFTHEKKSFTKKFVKSIYPQANRATLPTYASPRRQVKFSEIIQYIPKGLNISRKPVLQCLACESRTTGSFNVVREKKKEKRAETWQGLLMLKPIQVNNKMLP